MNRSIDKDKLIQNTTIGIVYHTFTNYGNYGIKLEELINIGFTTAYSLASLDNQELLETSIKKALRKYIYDIKKYTKIRCLVPDLNDIEIRDEYADPSMILEKDETKQKLIQYIDELSSREQYIIGSLYFAVVPKLVEELAVELKISRQRVGQIRDRAFKYLKRRLEEND